MTNNTVFIIMVYTFHLQTIFFVELYPPETRKLLERLVNYVIYKVNFFYLQFLKKHILIIPTSSMYLFKYVRYHFFWNLFLGSKFPHESL